MPWALSVIGWNIPRPLCPRRYHKYGTPLPVSTPSTPSAPRWYPYQPRSRSGGRLICPEQVTERVGNPDPHTPSASGAPPLPTESSTITIALLFILPGFKNAHRVHQKKRGAESATDATRKQDGETSQNQNLFSQKAFVKRAKF